jgi:Tat protein secretion system quality control protein TatD with DNase activity
MEGVEPPEVRPKHLPHVVAALAELRGLEPREIGQATHENARRLFGPRVSTPLSWVGPLT